MAAASKSFTLVSWSDEQMELQLSVRDICVAIDERDALSSRGNISGSHQSNVQAKNIFPAVQTYLDDLDDGLETRDCWDERGRTLLVCGTIVVS